MARREGPRPSIHLDAGDLDELGAFRHFLAEKGGELARCSADDVNA